MLLQQLTRDVSSVRPAVSLLDLSDLSHATSHASSALRGVLITGTASTVSGRAIASDFDSDFMDSSPRALRPGRDHGAESALPPLTLTDHPGMLLRVAGWDASTSGVMEELCAVLPLSACRLRCLDVSRTRLNETMMNMV